MHIREATEADLMAMAALSEAKRTEYEKYSPVFWRKAEGVTEQQARFFANRMLRNEHVITLVAEHDSTIEGFIIAMVHQAPPVYNPGGPVCTIDDFTVASADLWPTTGVALFNEATARAQQRGVVLAITVCGHLDEPKRTMLQAQGATIASEWYVKPLQKSD